MSTRKRPSAPAEVPATAPPEPPAQGLSITALAQEFDLTTRAIRFYEDMGLLTPRRIGRRRLYSQRDRTRLKLTLRGKRLGLSLLEIRQLVDMYESPSDTAAQLTAFLEVLERHRRDLEQQREDIEITLAEISLHEARCRQLLAAGRSRRRSATRQAETLAAAAAVSVPDPVQETLP